MAVFVLDRLGKALMPCSEKRARLLLARRRARVHRVVPFVIRLIDREVKTSATQPLRIKLDPGSKTTGLALVRDTERVDLTTGEVLRGAAVCNLFELVHRGRQISEALTARAHMRRRMRAKRVHGFQTGDLVRADVPTGKKAGTHVGRVAVRASGNFNIDVAGQVVQGIAHRHCRRIQRGDGYGYSNARIALTKGVARAGTALLSALFHPGLKAEVSRAKA